MTDEFYKNIFGGLILFMPFLLACINMKMKIRQILSACVWNGCSIVPAAALAFYEKTNFW